MTPAVRLSVSNTFDTLQHTATHCTPLVYNMYSDTREWRGHMCHTHFKSTPRCLQHIRHAATHCNTLQHAATHGHTLQHNHHAATHYNTQQHTATRSNTLQHAATHCNTLQHTATQIERSPAPRCFPPFLRALAPPGALESAREEASRRVSSAP